MVPSGYNQALIPAIVMRHDAWIRRTAARIAPTRPAIPEFMESLPELITFACTGEEWRLMYRPGGTHRIDIQVSAPYILRVTGQVDNHRAVLVALELWVRRRASDHLEPWLRRLARELGFHLARVSIRSQRTRWGSCSARKTVSLNLRLMFLPERLVRYVLLHELAHTKHLNHSRAFWKLVETLDPDYRQAETQLRTSEALLPAWLQLLG